LVAGFGNTLSGKQPEGFIHRKTNASGTGAGGVRLCG
jgi:hypothetical protein